MAQFSGGCLCGKVRYSVDAEPAFTGVCHCRDCQRFTGSAFAVVIGVPKSAFAIIGNARSYSKPGDSGQPIARSFCPECGSSIADEASALPGIVMISAGTLDNPNAVKPGMQIYCDSAQPWVKLQGDMQSFGKMPS
jgi:hypothetical protein